MDERPKKKETKVIKLHPDPLPKPEASRPEESGETVDFTVDGFVKREDVADTEKLKVLYQLFDQEEDPQDKKEILIALMNLEKDVEKRKQNEFLLRQLLLS